jgi:glutathione S-transferase
MKLGYSPRSPFVRKVLIVLHETGAIEDVELVPTRVAMVLEPSQAVLEQNPLGKIPVLEIAPGRWIQDSRVICEYLDHQRQGRMFPTEPEHRAQQLGWQALGDGLIDMLLLWRTELTRPLGPWHALVDGWQAKVRATMGALEQDAPNMAARSFGIGQVTVVCALGHLDFRWSSANWRAHFPNLSKLSDAWDKRASVAETRLLTGPTNGDGDVTAGHLSFDD